MIRFQFDLDTGVRLTSVSLPSTDANRKANLLAEAQM